MLENNDHSMFRKLERGADLCCFRLVFLHIMSSKMMKSGKIGLFRQLWGQFEERFEQESTDIAYLTPSSVAAERLLHSNS